MDNLRRTRLIQELREAREALLNINFATDTPSFTTNADRLYNLVFVWRENWRNTFNKCYALDTKLVELLKEFNAIKDKR